MLKQSKMLLTIGICLFTVSCATARVVQEVPGSSGVVAVKSRDHKKSRKKATTYMSENCSPRSYQITREGETNAGEVMYANYGRVHKDNNKEWFIHYKCIRK
jgi:hypothetical protein